MISKTADDAFAPWALPPDKRRFRRWSVEIPAYVDVAATSYYGILTDIAPTGGRIRLLDARAFAPGTKAALDLEGFAVVPAEIRHSAAGVLGLKFLLEDEQQLRLANWLLSANLHRRRTRHACNVAASLTTADGTVACLVTDLSRSGAGIRVENPAALVPSSEVILSLPNHGPLSAVVRHLSDEKVGLMFLDSYEGRLPLLEGTPPDRQGRG
jgi:PilZ domain